MFPYNMKSSWQLQSFQIVWKLLGRLWKVYGKLPECLKGYKISFMTVWKVVGEFACLQKISKFPESLDFSALGGHWAVCISSVLTENFPVCKTDFHAEGMGAQWGTSTSQWRKSVSHLGTRTSQLGTRSSQWGTITVQWGTCGQIQVFVFLLLM